jgi:hypothetical protein
LGRESLTYDAPFEFKPFNEPLFVSQDYLDNQIKHKLQHFYNRSNWKGIETRGINDKFDEYDKIADTIIKLNNSRNV